MSFLTGGIDEVGWGSLAGPIISVVTVFRETDLALLPGGVRDSKKCTEAQRDALYLPLCSSAYDVGVGHAWPWEIDQYGPYPALQLSYRRALDEVHPTRKPDILYVDGKNRIEGWAGRQIVEPKADVKYLQVSAASIIAKVFRDTMMADYSRQYPDLNYGWKRNKGYGTDDHVAAIKKLGLLIDGTNKDRYLHRLSYCKKLIRKLV
jgi:ribonuclease HII